MDFMKKLFLIFLIGLTFSGILAPKAQAMDPVTIAILAPYAMPYAEAGAQYALKGLMSAGEAMIDVFIDMFSIFLLPLGLLECTLGLPFGFGSDGLAHIVTGVEAPFKLMISTLMVPVKGITGAF